MTMANAKLIFSNVEDEKEILVKLSTFSHQELKRGNTLVFLDEIQECPEAELLAYGFSPTYYASRIHGEIDFVVEKDGHALPIEVKSGKHYRRHRALNHAMAEPLYAIDEAVVFNDSMLKVVNGILHAPIYMMMFLEKPRLPEKLIYDVGEPLQSFPSAEDSHSA